MKRFYDNMNLKELEVEIKRRTGQEPKYMEYDRIFKAVAKNNIKTFITAFDEFKDLENEEFQILDSELNFGISARSAMLDVHIGVIGNEYEFDLEMEKDKKLYSFERRMIHYFISLIQKTIEIGDLPNEYITTKCYVIAFLGYNLFNDDKCIHEQQIIDTTDKHIPYEGKIIYVCLQNYKECDNIKLRRLAEIMQSVRFVKEKDDDEKMGKLVDDIKRALSEEELSKMSLKEQLDYYDARSEYLISKEMGYKEGLAQGIEQGIKQGIEQGLAQGIEQGIKQGIEQGTANSIEKIVCSMYSNGVSKEDIAKLTNIDLDKINEIIK